MAIELPRIQGRKRKKKRKEKELWLAKAGEKKGNDQWSGRNCGLP